MPVYNYGKDSRGAYTPYELITLSDSPSNSLTFDGEEGLGALLNWIYSAWDEGRDLFIQINPDNGFGFKRPANHKT